MKCVHRTAAAAVALVLAVGVATAQQEPPAEVESGPEAEVREVFYAYRQALLDGDGETASRLVDAGTLAYFDDIKGLALDGSEAEVRQRAFIDRLLIVTMRHELDAETLRTMTLEDLLKHAIDAGWIAKSSIRQLDIGAIEIGGEEASGVALAGGVVPPPADDRPPLGYAFVLEDGEWKFRFASLVSSLNQVITEFAQQMGASEDDLIFTLVQALSGRQVLPEIWAGPVDEASAEASGDDPQP